MPELAAHLERAKELLDKLGLVVDGLPCYDEDLQEVAAALAACARESRKEAFEEAAKVVDGLQTSAVRNRMAKLIRERAAGEKA